MGLSDENPWVEAACAGLDPEAWFPEGRGKLVRIRLAQAVCRTCPLRQECLEVAMAAEGSASAASRWGIFGGLTREDRAKLARRRYRERRTT